MTNLISVELSITEWFKVIKALDAYQDILTNRNEVINLKEQLLDTIDIAGMIEEQVIFDGHINDKEKKSH